MGIARPGGGIPALDTAFEAAARAVVRVAAAEAKVGFRSAESPATKDKLVSADDTNRLYRSFPCLLGAFHY